MAVQFHAAAVGIPPGITWQWQSSPDNSTWTDIPSASPIYSGQMTDTLTVQITDDSLNNYHYRAVASNGLLTATSNSAKLTITTIP